MVGIEGIVPQDHIRAYNSTIDALERAVKERVFYVKNGRDYVQPPRPVFEEFWMRLHAFKVVLLEKLSSTAALNGDEFVATFRGRRKAIYQNALESLYGNSLSRLDSHVKVFVKYEKLNCLVKTNPVPRVISPRSPRYNVALGRYLRPLEYKLYRAIAQVYGDCTVIKGLNSIETGRLLYSKWAAFRRPVALGLDASRFDQHVSISALRWEHGVYKRCFRGRRATASVSNLLKQQEVNVCTGYVPNGSVRYTIEGGRMSGDMNTSMGNCLLMCAMVWAYAQSRSVEVRLANNGDDCVVIMEGGDLERFSTGLSEWFLEMGFTMTIEEPVWTFEQVEFCQAHPIYIGPDVCDYIMVRDPRISIPKDLVTTKNYNTRRQVLGWLYAVGTGGLSAHGGVPVLQEFYHLYSITGKHYQKVEDDRSWWLRSMASRMTLSYCDPSAATRASFYYAFGITPDEQIACEGLLRSRVGWFAEDLQQSVAPIHMPW